MNETLRGPPEIAPTMGFLKSIQEQRGIGTAEGVASFVLQDHRKSVLQVEQRVLIVRKMRSEQKSNSDYRERA